MGSQYIKLYLRAKREGAVNRHSFLPYILFPSISAIIRLGPEIDGLDGLDGLNSLNALDCLDGLDGLEALDNINAMDAMDAMDAMMEPQQCRLSNRTFEWSGYQYRDFSYCLSQLAEPDRQIKDPA